MLKNESGKRNYLLFLEDLVEANVLLRVARMVVAIGVKEPPIKIVNLSFGKATN